MRLCLTCEHLDEHRDCPLLPEARTSAEKVERVQRMLGAVDLEVFAIKMSKEPPTRRTLLALLSAQGQIERAHHGDLADFGQKRAFNIVETALKKQRGIVEDALGDAARLLDEDFAFAKKMLELTFHAAGARLDTASFDVTPLSELPIYPVAAAKARGATLGAVCAELDARLEETKHLDAKVLAWGNKNLTPLVTGKDPQDFPAEIVGGGLGVLGAIVGRGPASKRASAATQFKLLGDSFRERLYLLAANPLVLERACDVSQSEEALRKQLAGDGAAHWEKIRREGTDVLEFFLGPVAGAGARVEEHLRDLARTARKDAPAGLVPLDRIDPEDWETLARAYFLIYDASARDASTNEVVVWERVVHGVAERKPGGLVDTVERTKVIQEVRDAWVRRPPAEPARS